MTSRVAVPLAAVARKRRRVAGGVLVALPLNSPVVALNRAVALAEVAGPQAAIDAVNAIENRAALESYYLFHAVRGELEAQSNHFPEAAAHFRRALELSEIKSEQAFLAKRLAACEPALATA